MVARRRRAKARITLRAKYGVRLTIKRNCFSSTGTSVTSVSAGRIAVPLENSLVHKVDILDEGDLDLQTGGSHRSADRLAELSDNRLSLTV